MGIRKPHGEVHGGAKKRDVIVLVFLVVLLLTLGYVKDGRFLNPLTGDVVASGEFNEAWTVSCNEKDASDIASELVSFYGCKNALGMCWKAANGVELKGNIIVNLDCTDSNKRQEWINICDETYDKIC